MVFAAGWGGTGKDDVRLAAPKGEGAEEEEEDEGKREEDAEEEEDAEACCRPSDCCHSRTLI